MFGLTGLKTVPTERAQGTLHGIPQARLLGGGGLRKGGRWCGLKGIGQRMDWDPKPLEAPKSPRKEGGEEGHSYLQKMGTRSVAEPRHRGRQANWRLP